MITKDPSRLSYDYLFGRRRRSKHGSSKQLKSKSTSRSKKAKAKRSMQRKSRKINRA